MFQFQADPGWYDSHWHSDRPHPQRGGFTGSLARLAVIVLLLAGGGAVLSHVPVPGDGVASGYQDWEEE